MSETIGVLHPGAMGGAVASYLAARGNKVLWVSDGRSAATRERAEKAGLVEVTAFHDLVEQSTLIFSICPPEFATEVAQHVIAEGFNGTYCDANAIAPSTSENIAVLIEDAGAHFVDGGIIGNPPSSSGKTSLCFSGENATSIVDLFGASNSVQVTALDGDRTAASALKMCYAAWTKGSQALVLAVRAAAKANGVEEALLNEWTKSQPDAEGRTEFARKAIFKAWRFAGEMREIAQCFDDSGVTPGFHLAAEQVFQSCAELKDLPPPAMDDVLKLVANSN